MNEWPLTDGQIEKVVVSFPVFESDMPLLPVYKAVARAQAKKLVEWLESMAGEAVLQEVAWKIKVINTEAPYWQALRQKLG